jgi:hypothetical protein
MQQPIRRDWFPYVSGYGNSRPTALLAIGRSTSSTFRLPPAMKSEYPIASTSSPFFLGKGGGIVLPRRNSGSGERWRPGVLFGYGHAHLDVILGDVPDHEVLCKA